MNNNAEAQLSQNRLESIANKADVLVSAQVNVGDNPVFIHAPPYSQIYVANYGSDTVSVIDSTTNAVIKNITVGDGPFFIHVPPFGNNIYVTNIGSNTVSVINSTTNTVVKNITVGDGPFFIDTHGASVFSSLNFIF